jgi:TatD DNase family protein
MSPTPMRGKRNDSRNLVYVIERIADFKGLTIEKTADITFENARQLFNIY